MEAFHACDEDDMPPPAIPRREREAGPGRRGEDLVEGVVPIRMRSTVELMRKSAYPGYYEKVITDMHIRAVMCQTPTNKSQKDEEGGEEGSDRGAYHDPGNTSVARMPQEILVLLGGRVVSLVGHGHSNFRGGYDYGIP